MLDYGNQLKNFGNQLQNIGTQIQNIGMQMPLYNQNLGMQIYNIGVNIANMAINIFNIGLSISNNMESQMNNNNFLEQMQKMNMMNQMPNIMNHNVIEKEKKGNIISIIFNNYMNEPTSIITTDEKSVEELLNLFIKKIGVGKDYLNNYWFIFNGKRINVQEKANISAYGIKNGHEIKIIKKQSTIAGTIKKLFGYNKLL